MIHLAPGPVMPYPGVLESYQTFPGAPRLSEAFWADYQALHGHLQTILQTENQIAIMTGEGMVALWAGLKSVLMPEDNVVSIVNGFYGEGIADICEDLGATVTRVAFPDTEFDPGSLLQALEAVRPKMITVVHSETPTGLLNPLNEIATMKANFAVPLLYVDAMSSVGATPLNVDMNGIDILLGTGAKALGACADISFVSLSDAAWHAICEKNYRLGYEALLPFKDIQQAADLPYMPHWPGIRALKIACETIINTGLRKVYEQHINAQNACIAGLTALGLKIFQPNKALQSPSVTACYLPEGDTWHKFNHRLTQAGLQVGNGMGAHQASLFRIGHMGPQAEVALIESALKKIQQVLR